MSFTKFRSKCHLACFKWTCLPVFTNKKPALFDCIHRQQFGVCSKRLTLYNLVHFMYLYQVPKQLDFHCLWTVHTNLWVACKMYLMLQVSSLTVMLYKLGLFYVVFFSTLSMDFVFDTLPTTFTLTLFLQDNFDMIPIPWSSSSLFT